MANDAGGANGGGQMALGLDLPEAAAPAERPKTRDQIRSQRKHPVRAKSENIERMTRLERLMNQAEYTEAELEANDWARPKTRGECPPVGDDGRRRCPWLACGWHLKIDVNPENGTIRDNFPDLDFDQMRDTCALDVADEGGATLDRVAEAEGCTRERIRQIEVRALASVPKWARRKLVQQLDGEPGDKRRLPVYRLADEPQVRRGYEPPTPGSSSPVEDPLGWHPRNGRTAPAGPSDLRGVDWSARERTLAKAAERLGRATAAGLLRAAGLSVADVGPVHRMAASGLIRREGEEYVWVGRKAEAAE